MRGEVHRQADEEGRRRKREAGSKESLSVRTYPWGGVGARGWGTEQGRPLEARPAEGRLKAAQLTGR